MENKDIETLVEQSLMFDDDVNMFNSDDPELIHSTTFHDSGLGGFHRSSTNDSVSFSFNNHNRTSIGSLSMNSSSLTSSTVKDIFYCQNYFDLDDILSQTIRLSVKFQRSVPRLGFLDPSFCNQSSNPIQEEPQQQCNDIVKGTKLELPLWIVKELNADNVCSVQVPKGYNQLYREILEADANCVNLHKLGPNYYLTGKHLTTMNLAESEDIARTMLDTFTQRFHRMVNFALSGNSSGNNSNSSSSDLTQSSNQSISKLDSMIKSNPHNRLLKDGISKSTSIQDERINDLNQFITKLDNWEHQLLQIGRHIAGEMKRWQNRDLVKVHPNEMVVNLKKRKILLEQHAQQSSIDQEPTKN